MFYFLNVLNATHTEHIFSLFFQFQISSYLKFVIKYHLNYNQSPGKNLSTLKHKTAMVKVSNFPGSSKVSARGKHSQYTKIISD